MIVEFHNPEFPEGFELDVGGVVVVNGQSVEFEEEQLVRFEARNGISLREHLLKNQFAVIDGARGEVKYLHPVEETVEETEAETEDIENDELEEEGDI